MQNQILEYFAKSRAGYLHANGHASTIHLVEILDCQDGDRILEIGCGTGATLVEMVAAYPSASFHGVDISATMFSKAMQRLNYCRIIDRVDLKLQKDNKLPYQENSFDRIYIESVLAIQEKSQLKAMLEEIKRVLRPKGVLVFNETIWMNTTSKEEIERINKACIEAFGIIQANGSYPYVEDWKALLESVGFDIELVKRIAALKTKSRQTPDLVKRSRKFTRKGRFAALIKPKMRSEWKKYQREMDAIIGKSGQLMEGVLVKARKE